MPRFFIIFVACKDDIIKCRGEKVAPKAVENVLDKFSDVRLVAVIDIPDATLGQVVKAFIVPSDPNLAVARVLAYCIACLEDFMVPQCVESRSELPLTGSGKTNKMDLR